MLQNALKLQFVRFLAVGMLNTAFSYLSYALLLYSGLGYMAASFLSLLLGIVFSFRTQGAWVFRNHDWRLIFRFSGCWLLIYGMNVTVIALLLHAGLNAYIAGAAALLPVAITSYFVQRTLVFGKPNKLKPFRST